jgi:thymidylate synthase (FAD)
MKITLLNFTPEPERTVALSARLCYSSEPPSKLTLNDKEVEVLINKLLKSGHESPFEHINFTFGIEGISRNCSHQLVRHRIASYCLSADTKIKIGNKSSQTIDALYKRYLTHPDMSILLYSINWDCKMRVRNRIISVVRAGQKEVSRLTTYSGHSIKATGEHRFFTEEDEKVKEIRLKDIKVGDCVFVAYNTIPILDRVVSIERVGIEDTFDIEMAAPHHNFIAENIIVHNSQKSQRYVNEKDFDYSIPPSILANHEALSIYLDHYIKSQEVYTQLLQLGIEKEDSRYAIPSGVTTSIIVTMNARTLFNFFSLRCCNRAQWEIRAVAEHMLKEVKKVAPIIFSKAGKPCIRGACPEGNMSCKL